MKRTLSALLGFLLLLTALVQGQANQNNFNGGAASTIVPPLVSNGLLAQYNMTAGSGTTLADSSGKSCNGTFGSGGNAPSWIANTGGLLFSGGQFVGIGSCLNSAQTIEMVIQFSPGALTQIWESPLIATTTPNIGPMMLMRNNAQYINGGAAQGGYQFFNIANNLTQEANFRAGINGTSIVTWELDATADKMWINGVAVDNNNNTGGTAGFATATWQLGGGASGTGFGGQVTYLTGSIYFFAAYNRELSAAEVAQNQVAISQMMALRGINLNSSGQVQTNNQLVFSGDSITKGQGFGFTPWSSLMTISSGGTWNKVNLATGTMTLANLLSQSGFLGAEEGSPIVEQPYCAAPANTVVLTDLGSNDLFYSQTAQQTFGNLARYAQNLKLAGCRVIVATMISRTSLDTQKDAYNTLIRQQWPMFANGLADIAADPNMGADGASSNTTYFITGGVHPTTFASTNDFAPLMQRAVNRLTGNTSWTTATTYTTGAVAATATTAGSETSSTATYTFSATPANCQVGNQITFAGITPSGYNGTYLILTRSSTQVTTTLSTTGLGAITVQGTGVCPEQQDVDTYAILGGSATSPSFTLEDCQGYTGQNLYLKNANTTSPWVLTPTNSETIDGASTLTMPTASSGNNPVVVLQSTLVSASAGGCNWSRLQ